MIELDRTDEEREELVKQWIKDYWKAVAGSVVLAIAFVGGLNYYRQAKIDGLRETAATTEQVFKNLSGQRMSDAQKGVEALQADKADTSFSALATLSLAKSYFDKGDYPAAVAQYDWVVAHAGDSAMRDLARLRKARAQSNAKQYDAAVTTLGGLENADTILEANLLKGDILLQAGQFERAKQTYESIKADKSVKELVEQRLNLLMIKQQQPKS